MMSKRSVQRALSDWRAAVRRLDRVVRLRSRSGGTGHRHDATLARLQRQALDAEAAARRRYDVASTEALGDRDAWA